MAIDSSKQQALDADPKAIQKNNFTGILAREGNTKTMMFFHNWRNKKNILDFSQGAIKVL